jgi:hypothetical protein
MKRLVYSPSINVYVKSDFGIVDLTDYVTDCSVQRVVNGVSTASVSFRNPKVKASDGKQRMMFTEHVGDDGKIGPLFHPMDPIIITMTRLRGKPIQVFTGYCDSTPYVQLYPGIAKIDASCTLKKLKYTYWDPGLAFVAQFMAAYGWSYDPATGTSTLIDATKAQESKSLNDTGLGNLLMALLNEVGGWEKDDIILQPLPSQAIQKQVGKIYDDLVKAGKDDLEDYVDFLAKFVNDAGGGGATNGGGSDDTGTTSTESPDWYKNHEGEYFEATIYGPEPGTGTMSGIEGGTGLAYSSKKLHNGIVTPMSGPYVIAASPGDIPKNAKVYIWPNPFNYHGKFEMADTGDSNYFYSGSKHIDIYNSGGSEIASNTPHGAWNGVKGLRNDASGQFGGKYVKVKLA